MDNRRNMDIYNTMKNFQINNRIKGNNQSFPYVQKNINIKNQFFNEEENYDENQYEDNNLPIIIVVTQNYDDNKTEAMIKLIQEEFQTLDKDIKIIPVVAKEWVQIKKKKENKIEKEGIEELIKISFEKSKKAIYPAFLKLIK